MYIANDAIYNPYIVTPAVIQGSSSEFSSGNSDSQNNSQLIVQPNPFNETVHFDLHNFDISGSQNRIEFHDITGVMLYSQQFGEDQIHLDISGANFPEGMILYTLYINNVPVENGTIIRVE